MTMSPEEQTARERYLVLNLIRIVSLMVMLVGIYVSQRGADPARIIGAVIAFAGLASFFFVPKHVVGRWKRGDK